MEMRVISGPENKDVTAFQLKLHPLSHEKATCSTISPCLSIPSYILVECSLLFWQLHCDFRDLTQGSCHVMNSTEADSSPDTGIIPPQKIFSFTPNVLVRVNKMLTMPTSIAPDE